MIKLQRCLGLLAVTAMLASGTAQALTINTEGQSFEIRWSSTFDGADLSALAVFTLVDFEDGSAQFDVVISNTTDASEPGDNRLVSFGIAAINPTLTGVSIVDDGASESWSAALNSNFPGFHRIDLCLWAGNNCSGGRNAGLFEGATDSFTLNLFGDFSGAEIEFFGPAPSRWQSAGENGESVTFGGSVPEPGPLALFGLGLLGLALRQKRNAN